MLIQNHDRDINSETNRKDCAKDSIRDSVLLSRRLTELIYRSDSFVRHENKPAAGRENRPAGICDSAFTFPVLCDASLKEKELRIIDRPDRFYRLADFARAHYDELFSFHSGSDLYNQTNIRVDRWLQEDSAFTIHTSRTTYFDSLVTNRAMDFRLRCGTTVRDELYHGPFPKDLSESELSNHLGFNGFIVTADGFIPLVKRRRDVSTEKGLYGNSIQASLKTRYALPEKNSFLTAEGIRNSIRKEIRDELKIPEEEIRELKLLYACRNLMEGGKPQLLFRAECTLTREEIRQRFREKMRQEEEQMTVDGKEFLWIPEKELSHLFLFPAGIVRQGIIIPMSPFSVAAIALLIRHGNSVDFSAPRSASA